MYFIIFVICLALLLDISCCVLSKRKNEESDNI